MTDYILYDIPQVRVRLLPLAFTRPISEFIIGIDRIVDKWSRALGVTPKCLTADYLSEVYPCTQPSADSLIIASNVIPTPELVEAINTLQNGQKLTSNSGELLAAHTACIESADTLPGLVFEQDVTIITRPYHLFTHNHDVLLADFNSLTGNEESQPISSSCTVIGDPSLIHIAAGAKVEGAFLNTTAGPIYIGRNAEVMEGCCLRGPIAIAESSTVNMGTRIYGATTIGPHCKVGGEINNVIFFPYSNKAHDGFLGNAVIGSWCNIGAGAVASNLKNDYTEIKLWDYETHRFLRTGLQFCGLIMGDHSKAGINTMFNTATVTGVGVNIHGTGFPRNFVASFSEGSASAGFTDVSMNKFFAIAQRVMARRGIELTDEWRRVFNHIHELTDQLRSCP
ncbi:MAG: glucose-1-phosphate thymidylyltransferase [Bacteroides sp.]|nr:glucose-1-phosphate thymidylyltransferase [Bacteroides sp.]MCM1414015.1 glucose-1-phosphate thymidylyltransferase [Bacteroides sp.]MCM1472290.1 glucose-1-phosphate thymidylyltransferase [Bacteroides sp.]